MPFRDFVFSPRRLRLYGVICSALAVVSCTSKSEVSIPKSVTTQDPNVAEAANRDTSPTQRLSIDRMAVDCPIRSILAAVSSSTEAVTASSGERRLRPVVACFDRSVMVAGQAEDATNAASTGGARSLTYLWMGSDSKWTKVGEGRSLGRSLDVVNVDTSTDAISGSVRLASGIDDGPPDCQVLGDLYGNCEDDLAKVVSSPFGTTVGTSTPIARVLVRSGDEDTRVFFTAVSQAGCDPCAGGVGAASYRRSGGVWTADNKEPVLAQLGSDGNAPQPFVVWRSGWRTFVMFSSVDNASGTTSETLTLLGFNGKFLIGFEDVLQSTKGAANCAPSGTIDCFSTQGDIEVVDTPAEPLSDFPTVVIRRSGTSPAGPIDGVTTYQFDSRQSRFLPK